MLLYQKRGLQSWNCAIVHITAKKKKKRGIVQRRPLTVSCLQQRVSGLSDSRFFCCHLVEIEDVIPPRKITLFKHQASIEQRIRCRQKCRYFEDICFSFRGRTHINSKRREQLQQSNFGGEGGGFCFAFHTHLPLTLLIAFKPYFFINSRIMHMFPF